jgi:hypothetical protein
MPTPVQLALRRPIHWYDLGGHFLAWWGQSPYDHCELYLPSTGLCYSSTIRDGGVRAKRINLTAPEWIVKDLPGAKPEQVLEYFRQTEHLPYGFEDLLAHQLFNLPVPDGKGAFCSEWCAEALGLPYDDRWTPGMMNGYAESLQ